MKLTGLVALSLLGCAVALPVANDPTQNAVVDSSDPTQNAVVDSSDPTQNAVGDSSDPTQNATNGAPVHDYRARDVNASAADKGATDKGATDKGATDKGTQRKSGNDPHQIPKNPQHAPNGVPVHNHPTSGPTSGPSVEKDK